MCFVIDTAMLKAASMSRGTHTIPIWVPKKNNQWEGTYEDVEVPNAFVVVERGDKQSSIRGWGIGGTWKVACDCKRCKNTGIDPNNAGLPCNSCKGASFKQAV